MSEDTENKTQATPEPTTPPQASDPTPPAPDPAAPKPPAESEGAAPEFVPLTPEALSFPEDVQVDEGARDEFLGILNNRELSPAEQAQKLVDLQTRLAREASETSSASWEGLQTQWQDEVRKDPEIGGGRLEGVLTNVAKIVEQYGSPELREVMDLTGAGNNIHVIKFLNNMAKVLNEGTPVSGKPPSPPSDPASRLYPSMKE